VVVIIKERACFAQRRNTVDVVSRVFEDAAKRIPQDCMVFNDQSAHHVQATTQTRIGSPKSTPTRKG
jgi:hypothetical protein